MLLEPPVKPEAMPEVPRAVPEAPKPSGARLRHHAKRKWLVPMTLVLAAVILGAGWRAWQSARSGSRGTAGLITEVVKRGDLVETVSATGSVNAQTGAQVKIGSQITGRIKKLNADVGSQVRAGQIIAVLDLPEVQAQLDQAKANLAAGRIKVAQDRSGVGMLRTQLQSAIAQAQAGQVSAAAKLNSAQAADSQQKAQTPTDIQRGENGVAGAKAALSTAKSNLVQTQAGSDLQVSNSQQEVNQTQATARNSDLDFGRQRSLFQQGAVARSVMDQAQAVATVNRSLILAAQQKLTLTRQKNTADLQSGLDAEKQAEENVKISDAALTAARAETYLNAAKRANVGDARAALGQAEASLVTARGNTAQNVLKQQDVSQAQDAVRAEQEQVAEAQAQVDKTVIRSPISGTVLQLAAQQGETLAAGLASPTLIVVADLKRLQVDAYVDETDIGRVQLHQSVVVTVDAFPNKQFAGFVTKIASGSTIQQGVITYDVTVALDNPERQLKPDMTANVTIQTSRRTNVLLVPSEAVKIGVGGLTVNVLGGTAGAPTVESRKVTAAGTDGVDTEIRSGLTEGETVILAGTLKAAAVKKS